MTRHSRTRRRAVTPRPIRPTTSRVRMQLPRWRSSRPSPSTRAWVSPTSTYSGITTVDAADVKAARDLDMVIRLVGAARLVDGSFDVRVEPALVDKQHPLAKVDGAFNAVMLQGDAIREITLEGPGAGGTETASAVIADMVSVIGTMGTGFLQNDAAWRELPRLPSGESSSPFYFRLSVEDRPGALARVADELAAARRLDRAAPAAAERQRRRLARRHARGAHRSSRRRARGARIAARGAQALAAAARDLGSRRLGARMGVTSQTQAPLAR